MKSLLSSLGAIALALAAIPTASAAPRSEIRIGMVSTMTTSAGAGGEATRQGIELAVEKLGGRVGGIPVRMFYEDDALQPELGKQKTEKLILEDKVDFLVGYNYSNIVLAALKPAIDSKTFLLSISGPSQLAGRQCSPYFFAVRDQNGQAPRAVGQVLNQRGIKTLYTLAPNYAAGKDMIEGVTGTFKGTVVGQDLTKWPSQLDFAAEIAKIRAAKPEAVFVFLPPQHAIQFMAQYSRAGLKGVIPIYSTYTFDGLTLPVIGNDAVGSLMSLIWAVNLDNPVNKEFVAAFQRKHGKEPSSFSAHAYDAMLLIDAAVKSVKGELDDKEKVRAALKAGTGTTRGPIRFGNNQFPIQDYHLIEVKAGESATTASARRIETIETNVQDVYAQSCPLK
jgi:branched-chain amino acid transport system substrate-binding protein